MSQHRSKMPGSSSRQPVVESDNSSPEDALSGPAPSTDDTPTIISRNAPPPVPSPGPVEDSANSIRGRKLAHYELIDAIGVGGMAAVIRARDTHLDRLVALKILPPEMACDAENVRRFHQEARSAAKLDHENIARVFFCGEDQRLHFIAFEFVEGENLRTILERRGRLPVREALHYMIQIAAGLAHAACRAVVHRDIKPSNIIITPNGRAKLVDMGLARSMEPRTDNDLTQSGVTLGTFDYISPEQALEPRDANVRSDIYSLGCTFYHVLTGRPPVPEGTAAKKLHHHQHVKPIDPREYVPDLPVEVVALLDHMMAKDPRNRFQSPDELVGQLLAVAEKVGAAAEMPEGLLSVETPVANPFRHRPVLWAILAVAAVVALVVLLEQAPTTTTTPTSTAASSGEPVDKTPPVVPEAPSERTTDIRTVAQPQETDNAALAIYTATDNATVKDLRLWLEKNSTARRIELRLAGKLDLSGRDGGGPGLMIVGKDKVIIGPRDPGQPVTLCFGYTPSTKEGAILAAVTIQSKECQIDGVQFRIHAYQSDSTTLQALVLEGGEANISNCEFIQAGSALQPKNRLASLLARAKGSGSKLTIRDSAFLGFSEMTPPGEPLVLSGAARGGQDAIVRHGRVRVTAENCVFGPHAAAFRLEGNVADPSCLLKVRQCSFLLASDRSAAFEVVNEASGKLEVTQSLFSRVQGEGAGTVLLRQGEDRSLLTFQGKDNRYHDLDGYWAVGNDWQKAGWKDYREKLQVEGNKDESRVLLIRPWVDEDPLQNLEQHNLRQAFAIHTNQSILRRPGNGMKSPIGASAVLGEELPDSSDVPETLNARRVLVVEEGVTEPDNGIYGLLELAVASAQPGDTILIRHNRDLAVPPVALSKVGSSGLTVRPARQFQPVLTLAETSDTDAALFRVHHGYLRLEGLEFRLPSRSPSSVQSVVTLMGNGVCELRHCVITLQRSADKISALATLGEPGLVSKLDMPMARTPAQGPRLLLENCFVRGDGDLVWSRQNRPFLVEVNRSLAALSGHLLHLEPTPEKAFQGDLRVELRLEKITAFLSGSLAKVSLGKDPRNLVPVKCKASDSLLIAATPALSLLQLEAESNEDRTALKERVSWSGAANAYGGYVRITDVENSENMGGATGMEKWKMLSAEESSRWDAKIDSNLTSTPFTRIEPAQFKGLPGPGSKVGVQPLKDVPRPVNRTEGEPPG